MAHSGVNRLLYWAKLRKIVCEMALMKELWLEKEPSAVYGGKINSANQPLPAGTFGLYGLILPGGPSNGLAMQPARILKRRT